MTRFSLQEATDGDPEFLRAIDDYVTRSPEEVADEPFACADPGGPRGCGVCDGCDYESDALHDLRVGA